MARKTRNSRSIQRAGSSAWKAAKTTGRYADKAAGSFAKWLTTDHTGFGEALINMPPMGFWNTVQYVVICFILAILGSLLSGLILFLMIAYGIPYFLFGSIP